MILLFTDYGLEGPYIGQVEAVLHQHVPQERVINLLADAPRNNPKASAYLLAAYTRDYPAGSIFFCVIDPGVGSFEDKQVVINIDDCWYVGPHNGLFDIVARRANKVDIWEITSVPEKLSSSFHGRDLYAPTCASIAKGEEPSGDKIDWRGRYDWPNQLEEIIYVDHFGNCMTGIFAQDIDKSIEMKVADNVIKSADTFSAVPVGEIFWYQNANGLVEIAINQGNASEKLALTVGSKCKFVS